MIFFLRSNISGLAMYRVDSLISVLDKLLLIVICGVLLYANPLSGNFKIEWFVYAQTGSFLITALAAFLIVNGKLKSFRLKFDLKFLLLILKESYPYALIGFLMTIYTRIDGVMLERMLTDGKTQAGIYASAYRLLDASNMLGFLFAGLLLPMFSRMIKKEESIKLLLRFSFQLIWVASVGLVVACFFYRAPIMKLLYVEATDYWAEVFGYLILNFVAISAIYIYGALLTANENIKPMNIIFFMGAVLNILLNYFLIPFGKCMGAVQATLITQYAVMLALMFLTQRAFSFRIDLIYISRLLGFAFALILLSWGWKLYFELSWWINFGLVLIFALLLAFSFRIIELKKIGIFWETQQTN
jgi:O-antigen/teichoic acid export membrane protein